MRTVSTAQEDVLKSAAYDVYLRVEVEDDNGTFANLSDLPGDWVEGAQWGSNIDQPVPEVRVQLRRDQSSSESLVPLAEESSFNVAAGSTAYAPLLDAGRELKVYTATAAAGAAPPASSAMQLMAHAEIDEVGWAKSPMELVGRSKIMSQLADQWVREERVYGSVTGVAIETVIQSILDDWTDGSITLWVPSSPGFNILKYNQQKMSVLDAITALVQLIGWDCREVYNSTSDALELKLYQPNRAASTGDAVWTFGSSEYYDVGNLNISRADVRNAASILFPTTAGTRSSILVEDTVSQDKYGYRWMEVQEGDDSSITSSSEAYVMGSGMISDLADPQADQQIELPYFWPVELQDYQEYLANNVHYSTDECWAVYGLTHTLSLNKSRTQIQVRGKPAGQYLSWLTRQGGVASTGLPLALKLVVLDSHPGTLLSGGPFIPALNFRYIFLSWTAASTMVQTIDVHTYTVGTTDLDVYWAIETSGEVKGRESVALASLTDYSSVTIRSDATPYNSTKTSTESKLTALTVPASCYGMSTSTGGKGPTLYDELEGLIDTPEAVVKAFLSSQYSSSGGTPNSSDWFLGNVAAVGAGLTMDYLDTLIPQWKLNYVASTAPYSTASYGDLSSGQLYFQVTTS